MRQLIRTNGESIAYDKPVSMDAIRGLLGTDALHVILLKDGIHVMIIDDWGATKELPVNIPGTAFYWEKCGGQVDWHIHGDVFICPDDDANT